MQKKQSKPVEKKTADDQKIKPAQAKDKTTDEEAKPFDFGGLPERDLKKNLGGCG